MALRIYQNWSNRRGTCTVMVRSIEKSRVLSLVGNQGLMKIRYCWLIEKQWTNQVKLLNLARTSSTRIRELTHPCRTSTSKILPQNLKVFLRVRIKSQWILAHNMSSSILHRNTSPSTTRQIEKDAISQPLASTLTPRTISTLNW